MLFVKHLLLCVGIAMFIVAVAILAYDAYLFLAYRRRLPHPAEGALPGPEPTVRWRTPVALVMLAWAPLFISAAIVIVPKGTAGVRVSQIQSALAGTLYPGVHFVMPMTEHFELYNTRDQFFTPGFTEDSLLPMCRQPGAISKQARHAKPLEPLAL